MVPLGISLATAVVVGRKKGEGRIDLACQAGWNGVLLGTGLMALLGGVLLIFPDSILSVYTQDTGVLAVATKLLWVAGIFQVADGMQVTLSGALRGFGNTRASMGFNGIGHWLVGFPAMVLSLWIFERGVQGIWVSLCAGLFVVATGLLWAWDRETA